MPTYAIGDIQGCFNSLRNLLDRITFQPRTDRIWLVGDLVNRGPKSLSVLRYLRQTEPAVQVVLGNHDLFLLAVAEGIVPPRPNDTIQDVLAAPDRNELLTWLRQQPLHHHENGFFMVHAGLLPQWTIADTVKFAREVEAVLSGPNYRALLQAIFQNPPPAWKPSLSGMDRLVSITRVLTRLRTCTPTGEMSNFSGDTTRLFPLVPYPYSPQSQYDCHHRSLGCTWPAHGAQFARSRQRLRLGEAVDCSAPGRQGSLSSPVQ
jgi:bis(5'-nucleosyl)-tetraphosphatase (symmetrical)